MSGRSWDDCTSVGVTPDTTGPNWLRGGAGHDSKTARALAPTMASPYPPAPSPSAPAPPPSPPPPAPGATLGQALSGGGLLAPHPLRGAPPLDPYAWQPGVEHTTPRVAHGREAGRSGLVAASTAAADPATVGSAGVRAAPRSSISGAEPFQLLWFHAERVGSVAISTAAPPARPNEEDEWIKPSQVRVSSRERGDGTERASAVELLGSDASTDVSELGAVLAGAVRTTGEIPPTFAVLRGELMLPLCEIQRLHALASALEPFGAVDKRLADAAAHATEVSQRKVVSTDAVDAATRRLLEAHGAAGRPAGELELATDQAILRVRAFQRRAVCGEEHVRALFSQGGRAVPVYLPAAAAAALPLCQRLRAVLCAEVMPSQDETESSAVCLRAVALARVVSLRG